MILLEEILKKIPDILIFISGGLITILGMVINNIFDMRKQNNIWKHESDIRKIQNTLNYYDELRKAVALIAFKLQGKRDFDHKDIDIINCKKTIYKLSFLYINTEYITIVNQFFYSTNLILTAQKNDNTNILSNDKIFNNISDNANKIIDWCNSNIK